MKITSNILENLKHCISGQPPETGGILGSKDSAIITECVLDQPNPLNGWCCSYSPDVDFLNSCIDNWEKEGIRFMGIFHTHFADVSTLSRADMVYIENIMRAMPEEISYLYFPLYLLPSRELVCYRACLKNGLPTITKESCQIIYP